MAEKCQPRLQLWPLGSHDGEASGITGNEVGGHSMGAQYALKSASDTLDSCARALVARIRVKADAKDAPRFKRMRQHEQFSLGVGSRADCRLGEPCVSDLADVGVLAAVAWMVLGPCPSLDVKATRGSDDSTIFDANNGEWSRFSRIAPGQRGINVLCRSGNALWDGAPQIERWVGCRGIGQAFRVDVVKRF